MNRLALLSVIFVLVACQSDQTGPSPQRIGIPFEAVSDEGPPSQYPLNVRLIEESPTADYLITRGTYTIDAGTGVDIGHQTIVIPTYGNYWRVAANNKIRLEISNVDSPYLTPSREPSTTTISSVRLGVPIR